VTNFAAAVQHNRSGEVVSNARTFIKPLRHKGCRAVRWDAKEFIGIYLDTFRSRAVQNLLAASRFARAFILVGPRRRRDFCTKPDEATFRSDALSFVPRFVVARSGIIIRLIPDKLHRGSFTVQPGCRLYDASRCINRLRRDRDSLRSNPRRLAEFSERCNSH